MAKNKRKPSPRKPDKEMVQLDETKTQMSLKDVPTWINRALKELAEQRGKGTTKTDIFLEICTDAIRNAYAGLVKERPQTDQQLLRALEQMGDKAPVTNSDNH